MSSHKESNLSTTAQEFLQNSKKDIKVAIVCSRFNHHITEPLLQGVMNELMALELLKDHISTIFVPGAVEISLAAQHLARQKKFQAIIALGAVIRGDTSHYDYVCQQVSDGCLRVSLDEHIPVIFGVLTTETEKQAQDRIAGSKYYVHSAIEMMALMASH